MEGSRKKMYTLTFDETYIYDFSFAKLRIWRLDGSLFIFICQFVKLDLSFQVEVWAPLNFAVSSVNEDSIVLIAHNRAACLHT